MAEERKVELTAEDIDEECRRRAEDWKNIEPVKSMGKRDLYIAIAITVVCIGLILYAYFGLFPMYVP